MSLTATLKTAIKSVLRPEPKPITDFDYRTLPWIDKKDADIDAFLKQYNRTDDFPYDLREKLEFWQKNGYVILEKAIPESWLDMLWSEVDEVFTNNDKYGIKIQVDLPEYSGRAVQLAKDLPQPVINGQYIKVIDFHNSSVAAKKIMLHKSIASFLEAVFGDRVIAMQSLFFKYGSQQATHQDFAYVVSENPSHLAAAWIAMEDIHIDSGPLFYYPGSHTNQKFNFGNGIFFNGQSTHDPNDFARFIEANCAAHGQQRKTLLIKKGDVLLWHAALAHGGDAINNPELTRKSFVCHYSSQNAYRHHRQKPDEEPVRHTYNGGDVFAHPFLKDHEDIFKGGETL